MLGRAREKYQRSPASFWPTGRGLSRSVTRAIDVQRLEGFKWAGRVANGFGGNMGIARRRAQLGLAEQNLPSHRCKQRLPGNK